MLDLLNYWNMGVDYVRQKKEMENTLKGMKNEKNNYYSRGVSPYIKKVFDDLQIGGECLSRYGTGYMWGVMGIVYNPQEVSDEDVKHWSMLLDKKYYRRITMKDSIRDSYLVALGILHEKQFINLQR